MAMNAEYIAWVLAGLERLHLPVPEQAPGSAGPLCDDLFERGVFYLVDVSGEWAGMGGFRPLGKQVAELKRIYIRPAHRGEGLGQHLLQRLLADARDAGHHQACLDSAPFMQAAQRLYEAAGFRDGAPYPGTEAPAALHAQWRFMTRTLLTLRGPCGLRLVFPGCGLHPGRTEFKCSYNKPCDSTSIRPRTV